MKNFQSLEKWGNWGTILQKLWKMLAHSFWQCKFGLPGCFCTQSSFLLSCFAFKNSINKTLLPLRKIWTRTTFRRTRSFKKRLNLSSKSKGWNWPEKLTKNNSRTIKMQKRVIQKISRLKISKKTNLLLPHPRKHLRKKRKKEARMNTLSLLNRTNL